MVWKLQERIFFSNNKVSSILWKRLKYITYKIYIVETYTFAKNFRYRLELRVKDESDSTIVVVFDKEAEKIVRIPATQVCTLEIKV